MYTQERINVNDHDFRSPADGIVIPHALYDLKLNAGYITLGVSSDTSEFACECIRLWWEEHGRQNYTLADSILLLCDCGGSNSSRYYIFKKKLQELVNEIGIEIRIAHYPPRASKYNLVEHRFFPHVTRACKGLIFKDMVVVQKAISSTKRFRECFCMAFRFDLRFTPKRRSKFRRSAQIYKRSGSVYRKS